MNERTVHTPGNEYEARLAELIRPYQENNHEVDIVEMSTTENGGSMIVIVDGIIIMAEVHGK